jgi:hypothetical protein
MGIGIESIITHHHLAIVGDMRGCPGNELQVVHLEVMEQHPIEDGPLRLSRTIDSRYDGSMASRNGPPARYEPVSLKEREEPRLKRANQAEKASTGVAARWREMETAGKKAAGRPMTRAVIRI